MTYGGATTIRDSEDFLKYMISLNHEHREYFIQLLCYRHRTRGPSLRDTVIISVQTLTPIEMNKFREGFQRATGVDDQRFLFPFNPMVRTKEI